MWVARGGPPEKPAVLFRYSNLYNALGVKRPESGRKATWKRALPHPTAHYPRFIPASLSANRAVRKCVYRASICSVL